MKFYLLLLAVLVYTAPAFRAQGIDFRTAEWQELLGEAKAQDKLIFVDAYAEWCGPCKMMDARVFPDDELGQFFNANFVNVKYDMEKEESLGFRQTHRVTAYPTMFFINPENEVVYRVVGARQARQLLSEGREALARYDPLPALKTAYEAGEEGAVYPYIRTLINKGESHLRIANEHFRGLGDYGDNDLRLLLVSATEADSRLYDLLLEHRAAIDALKGAGTTEAQARRAVRATFEKALAYNDDRLMDAAVDKLAALDREAAKALELEGKMRTALAGVDRKAAHKNAETYLKKGAAGNAERLRRLYTDLKESNFIDYGEMIDLAAASLRQAAELSEEGWRDYYRLARFLQERRRYEQAVTAAEHSLRALGPDGPANYKRAVEGLVSELRTQAGS